MRRDTFGHFTLATVIGLASACATVDDNGGPPANLTEILWLPPEARLVEVAATPVAIVSGRSVYVDGSAAVVFTIEADPVELTSRIVEHVGSRGLHQRRTQYLNPQQKTSFEGGWQAQGGGVLMGDPSEAQRRGPYRRWHGEWEDDLRNVLVYEIGGQGRELRGLASYVPRPVVENALRKLGR